MLPTLSAQANGPAMTTVSAGLFGHKAGVDNRNVAMDMAQNTILATDAVAGKDIVDPGRLQQDLRKVIDGVVQCLNSSVWSKAKSA